MSRAKRAKNRPNGLQRMLGWKSVVASWSILSAIGIVSLVLSKKES